jgi:hypothetical protein
MLRLSHVDITPLPSDYYCNYRYYVFLFLKCQAEIPYSPNLANTSWLFVTLGDKGGYPRYHERSWLMD